MRLIRFFLRAFKSNYGQWINFLRCKKAGGGGQKNRNTVASIVLHLFKQVNKFVQIIV